MRRLAIPAAMLLVACGARSGVGIDERASDRADAGFDTFPCRWSLAQATRVGDATEWGDVAGAVHATGDEVAIVGEDVAAADGRFGMLLRLGDPPPVVRGFRPAAVGPMLGVGDGWVQLVQRAGTCDVVVYDRLLAPGETHTFDGACTLEPNDSGHLDLTRITPDVLYVTSWPIPGERLDWEITGPVEHARSVRMDPHGWIVVTVEGGRLRARRLGSASVSGAEVDLGPHRDTVALALDRVRPAAVLLRRDPGGIWRLDRIPFDGEPRLVSLANLSGLTSEPFGTLVTNETEAMIPLRDGRVAIAPVDGSAVRFVGPVPEAPVDELQVVMRPGSSGGGLLYTHREGGRHVLTFRPLTCNR